MARKRRKPPERDHAAILAKLDEVEAEMKRIGYWVDEPPPTGPVKSFLDIPFELWLQTVFLPHAREAVRTRKYPERKSMVGLAALRQYDYHGTVTEALPLMDLLYEFDKLVNV
jgi:uncharacterized protein YqcC (DUF446 family)